MNCKYFVMNMQCECPRLVETMLSSLSVCFMLVRRERESKRERGRSAKTEVLQAINILVTVKAFVPQRHSEDQLAAPADEHFSDPYPLPVMSEE